MSAGAYYNGPVADWAKQNIRGRVQVRTLFSSKIGMIVVLALLFCVPLFFIALGVLQLLLGVRDRNSVGGAFACGFVMLFPAALIYVFGMYVRQSFAKSLDAEGVTASLGRKYPWGKLYYVDHVSKHTRFGRVSRHVKDNQLELVFEGGKAIIPPLIHDRAMVWDLINRMPVEVRDDGVVRQSGVPGTPGGNPIRNQEDLMAYLQSLPKPPGADEH